MEPTLAEKVRSVLVAPTLTSRSQPETFNTEHHIYRHLLEHPDQMERLRGDPGLIKPAVEELLRYAGPLETATERFAREDVAVAGVAIPRGAMVFAAIASANRDERQFPDPDARMGLRLRP